MKNSVVCRRLFGMALRLYADVISGCFKCLKLLWNGAHLLSSKALNVLKAVLTVSMLSMVGCGKIVVEPKSSTQKVVHKFSGEAKVRVVLDLGSLKNVYSLECSSAESLSAFGTSEACEAFRIAEFIKSIQDNLNK